MILMILIYGVVKNYWATPVEFIGVNGGDCEDYSTPASVPLILDGVIRPANTRKDLIPI
jgi:predicted transglutaminase-like cysteine proteinase